MTKSTNREISTAILVFTAYTIMAKISLAINAVTGFASVIWPSTGIAIASVLIGGSRMFVAVALGAFVVNYQIGHSLPLAVAIACGNALEAVIGASLVQKFHKFDWAFSEVAQVLEFVTKVVFGSTLMSAGIGATSLFVAGVTTSRTVAGTFFTWWLGDGLGALIILPMIMMVKVRPLKIIFEKQWLEFGALLILTGMVCLLLFVNIGPWRQLAESGFRSSYSLSIDYLGGLAVWTIWHHYGFDSYFNNCKFWGR